jgi:hypothetical protein
MQDLSTGELVPMSSEVFEELRSRIPEMQFDPFAELGDTQRRLQEAKDAAIAEREHQGPVFSIGEVIVIKGGKFRVNGITRKRLYLDSIPSC